MTPARRLRPHAAFVGALLCMLAANVGLANPTGGNIVSGQGSIQAQDKLLTITTTTSRSIIDWQTFSIAPDEVTRFIQPSSKSSVLNRVLANEPSTLLGGLESNGKVFLINPYGILVGEGANIDVAGFVASSLKLSNEDYLAGRFNFQATPDAGKVNNQGGITTPEGGSVYLIAPEVENSGLITAPNGEVILAAGQIVTLVDTGTPGVSVEITGSSTTATNLGQVLAEAGTVGMAGALVTQGGTLNASSVVKAGGRIFLKAGQVVTLTEDSITEASGTTGGEIRALADEQAKVHGTLKAEGGGFIETSAATVDISGAKVSAGQGGEWLIDPTDVTIDAAAAATIVGSLDAGTDVNIQTTGTAGDGLGSGNITVSSAIGKTAGADATLTLSAHNNIAVNADITSSSNKLNLNLYADSDASGGGITTVSSGRTIDANGGTTTFTGGLTLSSGSLANTTLTTATGATVISNTASLNNVTLDANLSVNNGATLTLLNGLTFANGHTLTLASSGTATNLNFSGSQTIGGTGEIIFGGTATGLSNIINPTASDTTLTIGPNVTVHGTTSGRFDGDGIGNTLTNIGYVNEGVIDANTSGKGITLYGNWTNTGTLKASAGTLNLYETWTRSSLGTWDSTGGTINFRGTLDNTGTTFTQGGSTGLLSLIGATVNGGTLASGVQLTGSNTFDGVTLDMDLTVLNSYTLTLLNGLTFANGHTLTLASTGTATNLNFSGNQTIGGTGAIVFGGTSANNLINATASNTTLTIGPGITVNGTQTGSFDGNGIGNTLTNIGFVNEGVIDANTSGKFINLYGNWDNNGTLKASAGTLGLAGNFTTAGLGTILNTGGAVRITGTGVIDNTSSTLDIGINGQFGAGGLETLVGTIQNGTLIAGADNKTLVSSSGKLDNVTIGSDLNESGTLIILNNLTLADGIDFNTGASSLIFDSAASTIGLAAGATAATLTHTSTGGLRANKSSGVVTIGSGVTVQGSGTLDSASGGSWINNGTVLLNTAGTLTINPTSFTNNGTIEAAAGTIDLRPTSLILNAGNTLTATGGTLTINPNPTNPWSNASGNTVLDSGTLNLGGAFTMASLGNFTRTGGILNVSGTLDLQNSGTPLDIGTNGQFGTDGLGALVGTIKNGTLVAGADNKTLTSSNGKLDNVTIGSDLTKSGTLFILNDLLLADGVDFNTGSGSVFFSSAASTIGLAAGATSATLTNSAHLYANDGLNNGVVTIGSGVTVQGGGDLRQDNPNGGWINNGTILNNTALSILFNPTYFTNNGTILAQSGTINLQPTNLTLNAGGILNVAGGTLTVNPTNPWSNGGDLVLGSGTLNLGGAFTLASLGNYTRAGGILNVSGTLDLLNSATPLDIGTSGQFGTGGLGTLSGTLKNGTIIAGADNKTLASSNGKLDNITIGSNLNESGTLAIFNNLTLADGIDFNVGASIVNFFSAASTIGLAGGATSATLTHTGTLYANGGSNNGVVTIGSGVTVQGSGNLYQQSTHSGAGWVNNGTILNNTAATLNIGSNNFTNNGTVLNSGSGPLNFNATNFTNNGTLQTTAGTMTVLPPGLTWTNAGLINIGAGTTFAVDSLALNPNGGYQGADLINNGVIRGEGTLNIGYSNLWNGTGYDYAMYTLTNNGTIDPGDGVGGTGTLAVKGNLVMGAAGTLHLDLGGTGAGEYDRIAITGISQDASTAQLGGTLEIVEGANGFYADLGDVFFNLLTADGGITGTFAAINTPADAGFTINQSGTLGITNTFQSITRWGTDSSGDWGDAGNWTRGVPTAGKDAVVSRGSATPTVTVSSGTHTANSLVFDDILEMTGGTLTLPGTFAGFGAGGGLVMNGGELVNPVALNFDGTLNWTAGIISGAGSINLAASGILSKSGTGVLDIQQPFNSTGTVNVLAGTLSLSGGGTNTGTVTNSGTLNLDAGTYTTLFINQGTMSATGTTFSQLFTNEGTLTIHPGTTTFSGGFLQTAGFLVLNGGEAAGTMQFNGGSLVGSGSITGNVTLAAATLAPGFSPGTINITGDLVLGPLSVTDIEVQGTNPGDWDVIDVDGNVTMDGTLNVILLGGFTPTNGDAFPFLLATGTTTGTFATVNADPNFSVGYDLAAGEAARLIYATGGSNIFTNAIGGLTWETAGNWSLGWVPLANDEVLISAGHAVTHATGTDIILTLTINSGNALDVSGGSLTVTSATNVAGSLTVSGGDLVLDGAADIADLTLSGGSFTANSTLALDVYTLLNGSKIDITQSGTGILTIGGLAYTVINDLGVEGSVTALDLQGIKGGLAGRYALGADIDATATSGWNMETEALGFDPIGLTFSGIFDGLGHTITGLYVNRPAASRVGLFGYLGSGSAVRNVGLVNASMTGTNYVGGLAGETFGIGVPANDASIANSYVTGTVSGTGYYIGGLVGSHMGHIFNSHADATVDGDSEVGGLVGVNYWGLGTIADSHASGDVSGNMYVGGLVGYNAFDISNSHATGNVTGNADSDYIGGLVGYNETTIADSYATGSVSGTWDVGGLAGWNEGSIDNSYHATGTVSGNYAVGGLVGYNYFGSITDSHAAGDVTGVDYVSMFGTTPPSDIGGLVGYNDQSTIDNSYATGAVSGFKYVGGLAGSSWWGTISNSYATGAVSGTELVGGLAGLSYDGLVFDSHATGNVTGTPGTSMYVGGLLGYSDAEADSVSVSYATGVVSGHLFVGGLVGGHEGIINDSYATGAVSGDDYVGGLVGNTFPDGFTGAQIINSHASGDVSGQRYIGGLVGRHDSGSVTDSWAEGDVTGTLAVGGLVGEIGAGTTSNSHYDIDNVLVNGGRNVTVGGLYNSQYLDWMFNGTLDIADYGASLVWDGTQYVISDLQGMKDMLGFAEDSYAFGLAADIDLASLPGFNIPRFNGEFYGNGNDIAGIDVNLPNQLVGLFGFNEGDIHDLSVSGSVTGWGAVGGLVGGNFGYIDNAHANVTVSGQSVDVGGLAGYNQSDAAIVGSSATGSVSADNDSGVIGGLVGSNWGFIGTSYATGAVSAGDNAAEVGGLAGENGSLITNSYATGAVSVGDNAVEVGGLVGGNYAGILTNTYSAGLVSAGAGSVDVGGLVGLDSDGSITSSYWNTETSGQAASAAGTGLTNAQMRAQASFVGWDFATVWGIDEGSSYPYLLANEQLPHPGLPLGPIFWDGEAGDGLWTSLLNWSTNTLPGSDSDVTIGALAGTVTLSSGSQSINSLVCDASFVISGGSLTVADTVNIGGTLTVAGGALTLDGGANIAQLNQSGGGIDGVGSLFVSQAYNWSAGTLGSNFANVVLFQANGDLALPSLGAVGSVGLITGAGDVILNGQVTSATDGILVSAGGDFINNAGSTALLTPQGRWLVYSAHPDANSFGGLDSGNRAIWGETSSSYPYQSVVETGNRYIFAWQPTVTFTGSTLNKTYGDDLAGSIASAYAVSGVHPGVANAFLADSPADAYSGAPLVRSTGAASTAPVAGSPYAVDVDQNSLVALNGYQLALVDGSLTIDKADATVTAHSATVTYNGQTQSVTGFTASGLVNGEDESVLTGVTTSGGSGKDAGVYDHVASGSDGNYNLSFVDGALNIDKAALTISAVGDSRMWDGTTTSTGVPQVSGLQGEDTVSGASQRFDSPLVGARTLLVNAGYLVNDGNSGGNYIVSELTAAGTITADPDNFVWISSAGGAWETAGNWNQGVVPVDGAQVLLPATIGGISYNSTSSIRSIASSSNLFINGGLLNLGTGPSDASSFDAGTTLTLNGGMLNAHGSFTGNLQNNGGIVSAGSSPGTLNIVGNYVQGPSGTLLVELGGLTPGSGYDVLNVSGTATFDGTLDVVLYGGFVPQIGDSFTPVNAAGGLSGKFAATILPADPAYVFTTDYSQNSIGLDVAMPASVASTVESVSASAISSVIQASGGPFTGIPIPQAPPGPLLNPQALVLFQDLFVPASSPFASEFAGGGFVIEEADSGFASNPQIARNTPFPLFYEQPFDTVEESMVETLLMRRPIGVCSVGGA